MMASTETLRDPEALDGTDTSHSEHPVESQDSIAPQGSILRGGTLAKAAIIIYICTIMAYIFLSAPAPDREQDDGGFRIARLVAVAIWMIDTGVLFICHARYLIRFKREIASAFFVSALGLSYLVDAGGSGITDGIGVIMVCIVIAALCPGALGPLSGWGAA